MGYDSTFIIGEKSRIVFDDEPTLVQIVATYDVAVLGSESHVAKYVRDVKKDQNGVKLVRVYSPLRGDIHTGNIKQTLTQRYEIGSELRVVPDSEYVDAGDMRVTEDMYGDPLVVLDVLQLSEALEKDISEGGYPVYRRLPPLVAMLREFAYQNVMERWRDLVVLHYGH